MDPDDRVHLTRRGRSPRLPSSELHLASPRSQRAGVDIEAHEVRLLKLPLLITGEVERPVPVPAGKTQPVLVRRTCQARQQPDAPGQRRERQEAAGAR